jgi:hypothetical protein
MACQDQSRTDRAVEIDTLASGTQSASTKRGCFHAERWTRYRCRASMLVRALSASRSDAIERAQSCRGAAVVPAACNASESCDNQLTFAATQLTGDTGHVLTRVYYVTRRLCWAHRDRRTNENARILEHADVRKGPICTRSDRSKAFGHHHTFARHAEQCKLVKWLRDCYGAGAAASDPLLGAASASVAAKASMALIWADRSLWPGRCASLCSRGLCEGRAEGVAVRRPAHSPPRNAVCVNILQSFA